MLIVNSQINGMKAIDDGGIFYLSGTENNTVLVKDRTYINDTQASRGGFIYLEG